MVPYSHILVLSGVLFALGAACVAVRRNILMILIGVEVMINAAGLAFVAGSFRYGAPDGQIFILFLAAMAASEVSVGLAMVVYMQKHRKSVDIEDFDEMKG